MSLLIAIGFAMGFAMRGGKAGDITPGPSGGSNALDFSSADNSFMVACFGV